MHSDALKHSFVRGSFYQTHIICCRGWAVEYRGSARGVLSTVGRRLCWSVLMYTISKLLKARSLRRVKIPSFNESRFIWTRFTFIHPPNSRPKADYDRLRSALGRWLSSFCECNQGREVHYAALLSSRIAGSKPNE